MSGAVFAQTSPSPITSSGLNTQINTSTNSPGETVRHDISGGTRAGDNLFHSFGRFNVPTDHIANFLNDTALPPSHIFGRVTGDNPSTIFGMIKTTGFESGVKLFLMNPAGIVFGPDASLNVGGSIVFTTADYLRLSDGARFNAVPNTTADALLSTSPITAYGFLGTNPKDITIRGSQLTVREDNAISLIGGDIMIGANRVNGTVRPAFFAAPGGQINLASVRSPGEVLYQTMQSIAAANAQSIQNMGDISLSTGAELSVSGNAAGTIRIRGGKLVIDNATIMSNTKHSSGAPIAVDVNITGDVSITDTRGTPAISAQSTGRGNAGAVRISSANFIAESTAATGLFALIDSHTAGTGSAGSVSLHTGDLTLSHPSTNQFVFIDSGTSGPGHGGRVTIVAKDVVATNTTMVSTGDFVATNILEDTSSVIGSSGNLTIEANSLALKNTIINTNSTSAANDTQAAGNISITASTINIINGQIEAIGNARGGLIKIDADQIVTENTFFQTETAFNPGGGIEINAKAVELINGSTLVSNTFGDAKAGDIQVTAANILRVAGRTNSSITGTFRPSGIFSNSFGDAVPHKGNAGNIILNTPTLEISGGRINTSTETSGHGGNVTITAGTISISGEFNNPDTPEPIYKITDIHPSGIFTKSVGNRFCVTSCGHAGNISITASSLSMGNGSQIDSGTSTTAPGGTINIDAKDTILMFGTLSNSSSVGIFSRTIGTTSDAGSGGDISLKAGQSVTIKDNASVSASSTGPGVAGNVAINAGKQLDVERGSITTQSNQLNGGNITLQAIDLIRVVDGKISTSALNGGGNGGNITIDPKVVLLQSSEILAQAKDGNGGSISIATPLYLKDQSSVVSADSQFGVNGTVTIQSPISNLSGTVGQLVSKTNPPQVLLQNRCVALAGGEQSTFLLAGRETLPVEPSGWLSSPVSMEHWTGEEAAHASRLMVGNRGLNSSAVMTAQTSRPPVLSLRRLTPPGFLVRTFAPGVTGCPS